jgi:outer membrane lipase/esterase
MARGQASPHPVIVLGFEPTSVGDHYMRLAPLTLCVATAGLAAGPGPARAANAAFQNFFTAACTAPSGALATRCGETVNGTGNLSGDSESSLNPTQGLSHTQSTQAAAQKRSRAAREQSDRMRDGEAPAASGGPQLTAGPVSLLVNVHGTWFDRDSDYVTEPERGFDGDGRALELGVDYRVSDRSVLGALAGFERTQYDFAPEGAGVNFTPAPKAGDADLDSWYLTLFGAFTVGEQGYLEFAAGYEQSDGTYRRNGVFQESRRQTPQTNVAVEGEADGSAWWGSASAGLDFASGAWTLGPYAGLTFTNTRRDGYTERDPANSGLAMSYGTTERDSLLAHAGLRIARAISGSAGVFQPQLRVEYLHEFETDGDALASRYVLDPRGTQYLMTGGERDSSAVNAGISIAAVLPNGWLPFLDYALLLGSRDLDRQRLTLGLRVEF